MSQPPSRSGTAPLSLRLVGAAIATVFAFPGLYLVWRNITTDADPLGLLTSGRTLAPLWRTAQLAVLVSVSAAVLGTALAWLSTRTDLPFRRVWQTVLPVPLVFPTFIGAAAFIRTLSPGGIFNDAVTALGVESVPPIRGLFGAWLVLTLFTYPYVYLPVAARLQRLSGSMEESARLLGDTAWQAFCRAVLPQISGAMSAGTLLVFLYTVSDFGAVQLMRYDTLTRAIATNYLARPAVAFALSLLLLGLALVVVAGERAIGAGPASDDAARSSRPVLYRLGHWKVAAVSVVGVTVLLGVLAPLIALVDWAADGLLRVTRNGRPLTIDSAEVLEAAWNTLESSLLAAVAAVLAVLPIAYLVGRWRGRSGLISQAVVVASFAVPGILIALALRFWTLRSGALGDVLVDTRVLLVGAYVVRFGSLALGIAVVAVRAVPQRFHDAAATLGASRIRRVVSVDLPLMTPGLLAAAGLVLLSTMKELPISLIIAPIGYPTLTTRIFGSFEEAFVAEAGIMAVILVVLSSVLSWVLVLRRSDHRSAVASPRRGRPFPTNATRSDTARLDTARLDTALADS